MMLRSTVQRSAATRGTTPRGIADPSKSFPRLGGSGVVILICLALFAMPAHAYLDPASGSMFLQLILGGLAGIAVLGKLYWHKFLGLFGVKKRGNDENAD